VVLGVLLVVGAFEDMIVVVLVVRGFGLEPCPPGVASLRLLSFVLVSSSDLWLQNLRLGP
jgi:hypothetical protein